jgi:hypothetical protein
MVGVSDVPTLQRVDYGNMGLSGNVPIRRESRDRAPRRPCGDQFEPSRTTRERIWRIMRAKSVCR